MRSIEYSTSEEKANMNHLIFASHNLNKSVEIKLLLEDQSLFVKNLFDINYQSEILETGATLQENALIKAKTIHDITNQPVFSDDSGLEVEALHGAPGVYSARYAGIPRDDQKNMELLLQNLKNHENRAAQFKTVICFANKNQYHFFEGIVKGSIALKPRGEMGFGYDPIFIPEGYQQTFAEMTATEKSQISHRARALQYFLAYIKTVL